MIFPMECKKSFPLLLIMTLSLLTLNVRGCSSSVKNVSIYTFISNLCHNPDIIFLQETCHLNAQFPSWTSWRNYTPLCNPSPSRGSGITTLLKNNITILETCSVYDGFITYTKILSSNSLYHLYNVLIPQQNSEALNAIKSFLKHSSPISDGVMIVGGDFNCTLDPNLDRLGTPTEHRPQISMALRNAMARLSLCDVWRRQNPNVKSYTWHRNNPSNQYGVSKARLDRLYIPKSFLSLTNSCNILPCSLSDHSTVTITLQPPSTNSYKRSAYWHFNNSLLEDNTYKQIIEDFWTSWRKKRNDFPNICVWWDFGKTQIKTLTQMYASKIAKEKRHVLNKINRKIANLLSAPESNEETRRALQEQKSYLNKLLNDEARGALVRARFQHLNEIDTCSSYFFNLEKNNSLSKTIAKIKLSSGVITENPAQIKQHIHNFYQNLYSRPHTDESALGQLLDDIPKLDPFDSENLDLPPTLDELNVAVKQLGKNKTPGLDGLTSEFFQFFWPILQDDFLSVLSHACCSGNLPFSFRRAVITLLPKKGDLTDIANWRPVSLLNTDYKIFAKLLSNRLKMYIKKVVHQDQSYCVPGRTIYDNICLIKDIINYSNINNLPLAVISLDQKKAFDNVDHGYLNATLRAMGFGETFVSYINLLYQGAESLVKVCGSLTTPFSFHKGIRQGCPLSGLLYSIAIEPFLHQLRLNLKTHSFQLPDNGNYCSVTAYADDVSIFITSDAGFNIVKTTYNLFSDASAANLNTQKSQGLWVGSWTRRVDQPLDFQWNTESLTFLGVRLGNTHAPLTENWSKCKQKLNDTLSNWKRLSSTLSLKGKTLIANQLAASKLNHFLAVLSPPENVLSELQELLVDFVWSGKRHYLKKQILFQSPDKGGLGLVCLQARMLAYRMSTIQRLLALCPHPAYVMTRHSLHQYKKLNFDLQLFQINLDRKLLFNIPPFCSDLLRAWLSSGARIEMPPNSISHVINMPINSHLLNLSVADETTCTRLFSYGIRTVRDLLHPSSGRWLEGTDLPPPAPNLHRLSLRLISSQLQSIHHTLLSALPSVFESSGLVSTVPPRTIPMIPDTPTPFLITPDLQGHNLSSKALYGLLNRSVNAHPSTSATHWHRIGFFKNSTFSIPWTQIYKLPTSKKEGDIQFRLLHNFLPSLPVLHHLNPDIPRTCGWCGEEGTIIHLFILCPSIQPALNLLHSLLTRLLPDLPLNFDLYWTLIPNARNRHRDAVRLGNFLIVSLKSAIYNSYRSSNFPNPLVIWIHHVKSKIIIEHSFYRMNSKINLFYEKWHINDSLFTIVNNKITWLI